jgi:hypothetical protein
MRISHSQTTTQSERVTVPLIWSMQKNRFVIDVERLKLGPNDRIEAHLHDFRIMGNVEDGFQLTVDATIVREL